MQTLILVALPSPFSQSGINDCRYSKDPRGAALMLNLAHQGNFHRSHLGSQKTMFKLQFLEDIEGHDRMMEKFLF